MQKITQKIYYDDPFLTKLEAKVIDINPKGIVLDKTISFPEGGGQEGDKGVLIIKKTNEEIPFIDTQKGVGRVIFLNDFPTISVDTPIYHKVEEGFLKKFKIGMEVIVKIDIKRRALLSASHSATHLMLMGIEKFYGEYESKVYGCHIKVDGGRLDFRTKEKFNAETIKKIEEYINKELIKTRLDIKTYRHPKEKEALYWECNSVIYPCGGMHLINTSGLKSITLKKKGLGKNGQRVSFTMEANLSEFIGLYHE